MTQSVLRYVMLVCFSYLGVGIGPKTFAQNQEGLTCVVQDPHSMSIASAAVTDDGNHVVSASLDGRVIVWDVPFKKIVRTFRVSHQAVGQFAIDAESGVLATGLQEVVLWDWRRGTKLKALPLTERYLTALAFSGNGKRLAVGTNENEGLLWDIASGDQLRRFPLEPKSSGSAIVALNHDGSRLLISYEKSDRAILWDADSGEEIQSFPISEYDQVKKLAISDDGAIAMTLTNSGTVSVWDTANGNRLGVFRGQQDFPATSSCLLHDGKQIVVASGGGELAILQVSNGGKTGTLQRRDSRRGSTAITVSENGKFLVAGNALGSIESWNLATGESMGDFLQDAGQPQFLLSGNCEKLLISNSDLFGGGIEGPAPKYWTRLALHSGATQSFQSKHWYQNAHLNHSGDRLLGVGGQVMLIDTNDGRQIRTYGTPFDPNSFAEPSGPAEFAAISGDASRVLTGGYPDLAIWDAASGKKQRSIRWNESATTAVVLDQDGGQFAAAATDMTRKFNIGWWDTATGEMIRTFRSPKEAVRILSLSSDDRFLAAGYNSGRLVLWETETGKRIQVFGKGHFGRVSRISMSDDGQWIAASGDIDWTVDFLNTTQLWTVGGEQPVKQFDGSLLGLTGDAKQIWTVTPDAGAMLWDVQTGKELCRVYSLDYGKQWIAVTPEGRFEGSEKASDFVVYRKGDTNEIVSDNQTINTFHRHGLLQSLVTQH